MRKIVQVINTCDPGGAFETSYITALCDDGSVWRLVLEERWHRLPDIPQEAANED